MTSQCPPAHPHPASPVPSVRALWVTTGDWWTKLQSDPFISVGTTFSTFYLSFCQSHANASPTSLILSLSLSSFLLLPPFSPTPIQSNDRSVSVFSCASLSAMGSYDNEEVGTHLLFLRAPRRAHSYWSRPQMDLR